MNWTNKRCNLLLSEVRYFYHFELFSISSILDDLGNEMENTETKMDSTLKKMAKILRMSNG